MNSSRLPPFKITFADVVQSAPATTAADLAAIVRALLSRAARSRSSATALSWLTFNRLWRDPGQIEGQRRSKKQSFSAPLQGFFSRCQRHRSDGRTSGGVYKGKSPVVVRHFAIHVRSSVHFCSLLRLFHDRSIESDDDQHHESFCSFVEQRCGRSKSTKQKHDTGDSSGRGAEASPGLKLNERDGVS